MRELSCPEKSYRFEIFVIVIKKLNKIDRRIDMRLVRRGDGIGTIATATSKRAAGGKVLREQQTDKSGASRSSLL